MRVSTDFAKSSVAFDLISGSEESSYERLLGPAFQVPAGKSFFDDFPVWKSGAGVPVARIGAFDGGAEGEKGALLSAASARTAYLYLGKEMAKVGVIGGVVTSPTAQGQGLASECIRRAESWLKAQGAGMAVLWSGDTTWYEKRGYHPVGHQFRIPLESWSGNAIQNAQSLGRGWCRGIARQLLARKSGLRVQEWDLGWIRSHMNTEWYWIGEANSVVAYAAVGRGVDLKDTVHEWGGDPAHLRELFTQLWHLNPNLQLMGNETSLKQAKILFDPSQSEPVALVKILDSKLLESYLPLAYRQLKFFSDLAWIQYLSSRDTPFWFWGLDAA